MSSFYIWAWTKWSNVLLILLRKSTILIRAIYGNWTFISGQREYISTFTPVQCPLKNRNVWKWMLYISKGHASTGFGVYVNHVVPFFKIDL